MHTGIKQKLKKKIEKIKTEGNNSFNVFKSYLN